MAEFKKGDTVTREFHINDITEQEPGDVFVGPDAFDGYIVRREEPAHAEPETPADVDMWAAKDALQAEVAAEVFQTPAPRDPSKVKAGDTVTVSVLDPDVQPEPWTVNGKVYTSPFGSALAVGMTALRYKGEWDSRVTLTAHTPAPEPEPEWPTVNGDMIQTAFSRYVRVAGEWLDVEDGGALSGLPEWRDLVVIDPASVDERDRLAAIIREVDGNHDLGAAALAEAILERLTR